MSIVDDIPALQKRAESFLERAKLNYAFRYGARIGWFFKEAETLAAADLAKVPVKSAAERENEYEAAKQMNIGTITGKYHQKALALKCLTVGEF